MSLLLRLLITGDWPGRDSACEWTLVNAQGSPLQRGRSEPRHWPAAERCELVLGAEQCLLLKALLPKGARSRPAEVIAYALEDQLIGEADAEHFVVGDSDGDGNPETGKTTPIWVIQRARLRTLIGTLRTLERVPHRAVGEIQLAPLPAGAWSVCLHADNATGFVRLGTEEGCAFDLSDVKQAPLELQLALQTARKSGGAPQFIAVYSARSKAGAFDAAAAAAWQTALDVPVKEAGEYSWRDLPTGGARNLLSGEFAPPRQPNSGWGSLKPALLIGLATLLIYSLFSFGEWIWLDTQTSRLRQHMMDAFRAAYPQAQAIVDPPLQMQRLNDQLRRERGQLGSTDFMPLLAAASEALGGQGTLRSIAYEDGRLELTLLLADAAGAERIRALLASRGLAVTLRDSHPAAGGIEAVFALRGTP